MPLGLNRSGGYLRGFPITLPHNFGTQITEPHDFGNDVIEPKNFGNPVIEPKNFGNPVPYIRLRMSKYTPFTAFF